MKNKLTVILSFLITFVTVFSGCSNGCRPNKQDDSQNSVINKTVDNSENHYQKITETDEYLVRNGRTDYYIVYPEDLDKATSDGVSELKYFFKKATGAELRSTTDAGMTHDDNRKVFSIGRTKLFETSGLTVDESKLGNDGHVIKTVGNTIYMIGGGYSGNLYAVYTFLERAFNFDTYTITTYTIDQVDTYKLYNYDIVEIPDIVNRRADVGYEINSMTDYDKVMHLNRLKFTTEKYGNLPIHMEYTPLSNKGITHNSSCYIPSYIYKAEHPKWYSTAVPDDVCFTAHGDEEELELLIEECAKKIEYSLKLYTPKEYPNMNVVGLLKQDVQGECACDGCVAIKVKYGVASAATIQFVNRLVKKVQDWMGKPENAEYKRNDFLVYITAYHQYSEAPVKYNEETKQYEPIDDSVVLIKGAGIDHSPVYDFDSQSPLFHEVNAKGVESIKRWRAVCPYDGSYTLWAYAQRFTREIYFYDTFSHFNNDYFRFLYEYGRTGKFFREASTEIQQGVAVGFDSLENYLMSKLTWNCNADMNALIDKWFNGIFGDAAKYVRQYFDELRIHVKKTAEENGMVIVNSMYYGIEHKEFWPYSIQNSWLELFEQAFETIEPLKSTNPEIYKKVKTELSAECVSPAYVMLDLYKKEMPIERRNQVVKMITKAVKVTNVPKVNGKTVDEYLKSLYEN